MKLDQRVYAERLLLCLAPSDCQLLMKYIHHREAEAWETGALTGLTEQIAREKLDYIPTDTTGLLAKNPFRTKNEP